MFLLFSSVYLYQCDDGTDAFSNSHPSVAEVDTRGSSSVELFPGDFREDILWPLFPHGIVCQKR